MTSDEGLWQSIPPDPNGGEAPDMNNPAAWPHEPYPAAEPSRRGWMTMILAALGSAMPVIGAVAMWFVRHRAGTKRRGIMAAMPSNLAGAEQMVRDRMGGGIAGYGGGRGKMRTLVAILAFALAGWGIRRTFAHS